MDDGGAAFSQLQLKGMMLARGSVTVQDKKHLEKLGIPTAWSTGESGPIYDGSPGMSLRDWLAGKALPTIIEADDGGTVESAAAELGIEVKDYNFREHWPVLAARKAYQHADAMIAEKRRTEKGET